MSILSNIRRKIKNIDWESFLFVFLLIAGVIIITTTYILFSPKADAEELPEPTATPIVTEEVREEPEPVQEVAEVVEEEPESKQPILSDTDIIAMIVMAEAGNQPMVGKVAVAACVLNRCDYWGLTVETVANQPDQFSYPYYGTVSEDCYRAVKIAEENRELFPETMIYFRNTKYHSFGEPYIQIGDHYFSTIKESEE